MIVFNKEIEFDFENEAKASSWICQAIEKEQFKVGEINYIFCSDDALLEKNIEFLDHTTLTDIISFDYTMGKLVSGDIFISIDRVKENAESFNASFDNELHRVMVHGVLHFCGYNDKSESEKAIMREKEDFYLSKL